MKPVGWMILFLSLGARAAPPMNQCEQLVAGESYYWGVSESELEEIAQTNPVGLRTAETLQYLSKLLDEVPPEFLDVLGAYMAVSFGSSRPEDLVEWNHKPTQWPDELSDPHFRRRGLQLNAAFDSYSQMPPDIEAILQQLQRRTTYYLSLIYLLSTIKEDLSAPPATLNGQVTMISRFLARRGWQKLKPAEFFQNANGAIAVSIQTLAMHFNLTPAESNAVLSAWLRHSAAPEEPMVQAALKVLRGLATSRALSTSQQKIFVGIVFNYLQWLNQKMVERKALLGETSQDVPRQILSEEVSGAWQLPLLALHFELISGQSSYSASQLRTRLKNELKRIVETFRRQYLVVTPAKELPRSRWMMPSFFETKSGPSGLGYRIARPHKAAHVEVVEEQGLNTPDLQDVLEAGTLPKAEVYAVRFYRRDQTQFVFFSPRLLSEWKAGIGPVPVRRWLSAIVMGPAREENQNGIKTINPPVDGIYDYEVKVRETTDRLLGRRRADGVLEFDRIKNPH